MIALLGVVVLALNGRSRVMDDTGLPLLAVVELLIELMGWLAWLDAQQGG